MAAGSAGLQVVDVSNRTNPSIVASTALPGNANDVVVAAGYAYVAAGSGGLQIVNVQNPLAPVPSGSLDTGGVAWDVVVKGNRAYVANGANGLVVADVSSPAVPVRLGALALSGTTKGVDVDPIRQIAVVARGTGGVSTVNVADASTPVLLATVTVGDVRDVAISGSYAFLADFSRSFTSLDLTNPATPVLRASTPSSTGGLLQDVVVNGTVAAGADVFFVNGVPLIDVSAPVSPQPRLILNFSNFRDDNGTGIAMDSQYVYLTAEAGSISENGVSGTTRLYIGQYRNVQDNAGIAPTVHITSPASGSQVVQGSTVSVTANASDDVAVASVAFLVDGQLAFTATAAPYQYTFTAPGTGSSLTLGAIATDFGNNVGTATDVVINLIPDPLTTVTGRVVDNTGTPVAGASVMTLSKSAITQGDGTFSIPSVPTVAGSVSVAATATVNGTLLIGKSGNFTPVAGGTTNVGDIVVSVKANPVTVGVASTGNCYPFMCNDSGASSGPSIHYQQVYSASAFSGPTQINSLTFFRVLAAQFGGTSTVLAGNYRVSLSTTTRAVNGLSANLASNIGSDNMVIFNGNLGGLSSTPSFTITASAPFFYDPSLGNVLLDIVVTDQTAVFNGSGNGYNDADARGVVTTRAYAFVGSASGPVDVFGLVTLFNK